MRVFDGHCDTIFQCHLANASLLQENPNGHWDLTRAQAYDGFAQFFALFGDLNTTPNKSLPQIFREQFWVFREEIHRNEEKIAHCRTWDQAEEAVSHGKVAAFLSVEGADMIGCSLSGLEQANAFGVRAINLTWNRANLLSGSIAEDEERGLSALGKAFVTRMEQLGILVDVSHLSNPGFWGVMEVAKKPVIASHSNAWKICQHKRNLSDGQFAAIVKTGGVAGLNVYAPMVGEEPTFDTLLAHLDHFWSLGGEDHVSLGGDWDGCEEVVAGFEHGIAGLADFYNYLLQKNYSETLVNKLFFDNLRRVVAEVCTM